jgi:hypothetical protein
MARRIERFSSGTSTHQRAAMFMQRQSAIARCAKSRHAPLRSLNACSADLVGLAVPAAQQEQQRVLGQGLN